MPVDGARGPSYAPGHTNVIPWVCFGVRALVRTPAKGATVTTTTTGAEGFSGKRTAEIVGITYRQLDYWARTDLVRPSLVDAKGSGTRRRYSYRDLLELKIIKKLFLPGNYAMLELSIVPNEVNGKCYLTFYVNHVRFKKVGDRIGGGNSMMDRFDGIDGGEGDVDPTAGDDDFGADDI